MVLNHTDVYNKFEVLFRKYYPGLVIYASRLIENREVAEDLIHDLFVHIWEKIDSLEAENIKAYLFISIRHRCLNYLEHLHIHTEYQKKIIQKGDIISSLTWEYFVESELRERLEAAIHKLPPQAQKIFLMSRFDNKTAIVIANELGLSPRTVEKHMEIALKTLKKELSDYLPMGILFFLLYG